MMNLGASMNKTFSRQKILKRFDKLNNLIIDIIISIKTKMIKIIAYDNAFKNIQISDAEFMSNKSSFDPPHFLAMHFL